ncbi:Hypothetical protein ORPV_993 [Orpheovirus IHUMI-LCC2]|uniref:Uncharacterized protein n=1 Tax=Orpheovirus IHUMI-LCC2 TaxID=2023057 RepID=A0A2I2L5U3_9VIRU|nr:Hypothetical protein ORPV_993 [Orpheovirus IHUMI-LCC2]SNW62897.1 Hypothetical protein ORPV_993 [Orpheovirus IHUMI-LCC2]
MELEEQFFDIVGILGKNEMKAMALFGGAVRDIDYNRLYGTNIKISDYDIRIWTNKNIYDKNINNIMEELGREGITILGDENRIRIYGEYKNIKYDLSFRFVVNEILMDEEVSKRIALDRVTKADVGLSQISMSIKLGDNMECMVWFSEDYMKDRNNKTLTIMNKDRGFDVIGYINKLKQKYPDHKVLYK